MSKTTTHLARQAEYFINGGRGYDKPYTFLIRDYNVKINCYFNKLTEKQLERFKNKIEDFFKKNPDPHLKYENKIYHCFIYKDTEDFKNLGAVVDLGLGAGYRCLITEKLVKQDPVTRSKQYFTNNYRGYENYHSILLRKYNIEVKCYFNTVTAVQLDKIKRSILAVFKDFFEKFPTAKNASKKLKIFKINIFNNLQDYTILGERITGLSLEKSLGTTIYLETEEVQSEIYISGPGNLRTLEHELGHALLHYAVDGPLLGTPPFIVEGIASYFERESAVVNLTLEEISEFTYQKLAELGYLEDRRQRKLYHAGHAVVSYLQAKHLGIIEQYLTYCRNSKTLRSTDQSILDQSYYAVLDSYREEAFIDIYSEKALKTAIKPLQLALNQPEAIKEWLYQQILSQPKEIKEWLYQPGQKQLLLAQIPKNKLISIQLPKKKSSPILPPQEKPLSIQFPQEKPLFSQHLQEKLLSTQPSFPTNKLLEVVLAWRKSLYNPGNPSILQEGKVPIVLSVFQRDRYRV